MEILIQIVIGVIFDLSHIFPFRSILDHHRSKTDYPKVNNIDMIKNNPFFPIHLNHVFRVFEINGIGIVRTSSRLNSFDNFIIYTKKETYFAIYQTSSKVESAGKEDQTEL